MTDLFLRDSSESSRRWIRAALGALAIITALVVLTLFRAGRLSGSGQVWVVLALGVFFSLHVASDIRRGRTATERYSHDPVDDAVRSAPHPSFFWAVIALKGAVAAVLIIAALGDLLGLWNLRT
ncbi:MAG TPA: hypothetical protein VH080_01060 [Gemmatimonadaceae bacterium]|jgi:hypothetical protein|nr:hypothetical protein [Gemmatimonadaceae bacterium]